MAATSSVPGPAGASVTRPVGSPATQRRGRWIEHWDPEDAEFWQRTGRRIARRNLMLSVTCEHLGFCVWTLWTVVVLNLANIGITLSLGDQFLLIALPNLIGALLRIPYTFAIPRFGGRAWTTFSASLLLIPCLALAIVVPSGWLREASHSTQLWVLVICAALSGVGGGNFSSSMANVSFFFPKRDTGLALGINAAGGNLGVAVCQLVVPLVIIIGIPAAAAKMTSHQVHLALAGIIWMPFIVLAAILAWTRMDSLSTARADGESWRRALGHGQTWVLSLIYIGTFGSFIGFSFALPLVIKNTFPSYLAHHTFIATYLAGLGFTGAIVGSLTRPVGGWISDRVGGARVTLGCLGGMALATLAAIRGVDSHSFVVFYLAYIFVFAFSGAGSGSVYRMIASIYSTLARRQGGDELEYHGRAAATIGIAGAIGAFGGFLIQLVFHGASGSVATAMAAATKSIHAKAALTSAKAHIATAHATWSIPALWVFLGAYVALAALTWFCYLRRRPLGAHFPTYAEERI